MEAIIVEAAIEIIQRDINEECYHIIDMVDRDVYDMLIPHHGLTKYIDMDDSDAVPQFESDMNQWVECIDKHSEITIPTGIHANVMNLHELIMDTLHAKCGYRKIIKYMYISNMNRSISMIYEMIIDLRMNILNMDDNDIYNKIYHALDDIYINTTDMHVIMNGIHKCMDISMQHRDITKASGIYDNLEIIYRCILYAMMIRPELHEELASAVFSPKRVEQMIDIHGMDWLDEL